MGNTFATDSARIEKECSLSVGGSLDVSEVPSHTR